MRAFPNVSLNSAISNSTDPYFFAVLISFLLEVMDHEKIDLKLLFCSLYFWV